MEGGFVMSVKTIPFILILVGFIIGCTESVPTESIVDEETISSDEVGVLAKNGFEVNIEIWFVGGTPPDQPTWVGEFTIDGHTYSLVFFSVGNGKPFDTHPQHFVKLAFFEEIWRIHNGPWNAPGSQVVLAGRDYGVMTLSNMHFVSNGQVDYATPPFEMWLSRKVQFKGNVSWPDFPLGVPTTGDGVMRIN